MVNENHSNSINYKLRSYILWEELQMNYDELDPILYLYNNNLIKKESLTEKQKSILLKIKTRNIKFSHKSKMPEICTFD